MSKTNNNFFKKYLSWKNILISLISLIGIIIFVFIFIFGLKRKWYDGLSVGSLIYLCLGLLGIIFDVAQFKTWTKLKNLFTIKKENGEDFNEFEKMQMKVLNINEEKTNEQEKKQERRKLFLTLYLFWISVGLILLIVSLPFIFN